MTDTAPLLFHKAADRRVLAVDGPEAAEFLQGLLTNDVKKATPDAPVYAALLTPQGKFLAEMLVSRPAPTRFLLDLDAATAAGVVQRLAMYKLRADLTLTPLRDGVVWRLWGPQAEAADLPGGSPDPRDARLGQYCITETPDAAEAVAAALAQAGAQEGSASDWRRAMIAAGVPISGDDLVPNDSYPLEMAFERLHGVDFRKGCYVGQEVTARMKHKATLKKGLRKVRIVGIPPTAGADLMLDGKVVGRMGAAEGEIGLALLRVDRVEEGSALTADGATLYIEP